MLEFTLTEADYRKAREALPEYPLSNDNGHWACHCFVTAALQRAYPEMGFSRTSYNSGLRPDPDRPGRWISHQMIDGQEAIIDFDRGGACTKWFGHVVRVAERGTKLTEITD